MDINKSFSVYKEFFLKCGWAQPYGDLCTTDKLYSTTELMLYMVDRYDIYRILSINKFYSRSPNNIVTDIQIELRGEEDFFFSYKDVYPVIDNEIIPINLDINEFKNESHLILRLEQLLRIVW